MSAFRLQPMQRWRLANRLAFSMVFVAALAIMLLFYDLDRTNRSEIEALQVQNLRNNASDLANSLDALVSQQMGRIGNLALSRSVVEFTAVRPDQRSALFTPTLQDFANFIDSSRFYRAVLLIDRSGEVLISTEGSYVGQKFDQSAFFQQAMVGVPFMSDPGISRLDRQPVIWLAAPVYTSAERVQAQTPDGIVVVTLSPEWLWQSVEHLRLGTNGYAMLVDDYGIRLAHGGDRRYVFRSLMPLPAATWAQLQREDRFGTLARIADTGSRELAAYLAADAPPPTLIAPPSDGREQVYYSAARMQSRNWTVATMLSEHEILAPANRVTVRGLGATLFVSVLLAITVWLTTRRILRSVPQLAAAATKIAHGDLSTPVDVRGSSEMHALAENFETMRQRLRASHSELATWATTLETRVAQRSQELAALSEVIAAASRTQSRPELLHTALRQALRVVGADIGGIWIADRSGALRLIAAEGFNHALQEPLTDLAPGEGLLGQVQTQGMPVALPDISQAPRLARVVVREQGLHAFAAVPLRIHGRTLGVMGMFSRADTPFNPDAVALAASIAQQIALTLDNLALITQVEAQAGAVASLQERERIAGEIHDSVAQVLSYLYLQTDRLAGDLTTSSAGEIRMQLLGMQDVLEHASHDVRNFIARLHDVAPPPAWLGTALRTTMAALGHELGVPIEIVCAQADDQLVDAATRTELVRIAGEAARNARRHGQATFIRIVLETDDGQARLSIRDDGSGFEIGLPPADGRQHFGLSVMRARATRIGGALTLASRPGHGAHVEVSWPLADEHVTG